jgi:hypothetical protein
VFKNKELRKIFRLSTKKVTEHWGKMYNDGLHDFNTPHQILLNEIKEDKMGGACNKHGREEKCLQGIGRKIQRLESTCKIPA